MRLIPIITEKTLEDAKHGKYTFRVANNLNKFQIRKLVEDIFGVTVAKVRTINVTGETKRTVRGKKKTIMPKKKAIVNLKGKDKIDLFEVKGAK